MINSKPVYLIDTTNPKIKKMFLAKKGFSLFRQRTVYTGICMNIDDTGIVSDTNGHRLFKMSKIQHIETDKDSIKIFTQNSEYIFAG